MSDLIPAVRQLEAAVSVQQILLRTLAGILIEREISSASDRGAALREIVDRWHELIDYDRTTSATPEVLQEADREMARQMVETLSDQISAWVVGKRL